MTVSRGIDTMFGLCRRQEIVARIVELLKDRYPQVAAATIPELPLNAGRENDIPLAILLREKVAEPEAFSEEIRSRIESVIGSSFSLVLLGESGNPEDAGLLRCGQLILDRDPRFRADYTWTAGKGFPGSLTTGSRKSRPAEPPMA